MDWDWGVSQGRLVRFVTLRLSLVSQSISKLVGMHIKVRYDFALTVTSLCEALVGWEAKGWRGAIVYGCVSSLAHKTYHAQIFSTDLSSLSYSVRHHNSRCLTPATASVSTSRSISLRPTPLMMLAIVSFLISIFMSRMVTDGW
jgi:hypothetical protein